MKNFYVVTFDRRRFVDYRGFHEAFVGHPQITQWWHYIKNMYIICTDLTEEELADHYSRCAKANGVPTTHLVLLVDPKRRQGRLPREAWEWFRKNAIV